jgi:glucose/arabinose dehydrogenase
MAAGREKTIERKFELNVESKGMDCGPRFRLGAEPGRRSAAAAITDAPAPTASSKIMVETFAEGLDHPWGLQFLPDGRLLVTERPGRMRLISKDGKLSEPIAGVPKVAAVGQGGLLDVLLAPDFEKTGTIYFSYGEPRGGGKNGTSVARQARARG